MASKKKVSKKTTRKPATASASLPPSENIPAGMKQLGSGYAPTWKPEQPGDNIHGEVTAGVREVEFKKGRKVETRRVMEVTLKGSDQRFAVWESAALGELFDQVAAEGEGVEVYIRFDGLGKKKAGQNPPKLFTVAVAA